MTKTILMQYTDLLKEADEVRKRIETAERELAKIIEEGEVTDVVSGGEGGIQHYTITGFPYRDFTRKRTLIKTRRLTLMALEVEIEETLNSVYDFIKTIDNSYDRRIVTMRIVDKMTWRQIAQNMGGGNTEDSVRKSFERFLTKSE